jgi:hypothetical protein
MRLRHWQTASTCRFDNNAKKMVSDLSAICDISGGWGDHFSFGSRHALNRQPPGSVTTTKAGCQGPEIGHEERRRPSYGTAIESTTVMLKNAATWELNVTGDAKRSFTIRAGAYVLVWGYSGGVGYLQRKERKRRDRLLCIEDLGGIQRMGGIEGIRGIKGVWLPPDPITPLPAATSRFRAHPYSGADSVLHRHLCAVRSR